MTVPFSRVPNNLRPPLFYVEFDNSMANMATATQRTLLIGQMLTAGTAAENIPVKVSSANSVGELTGKGSLLHGMMAAYLKNDTAAEIWILPLADDSGSMVAAKGSIKIASQASETGVISLPRGDPRAAHRAGNRYTGANCGGTYSGYSKKQIFRSPLP